MTVVTRQSMTDDSGTFTDGSAVNKAFIDQLYDQMDDQAHSTTNPTVKPKAITDEVVAARGSKASVDARLDVALNEDGTLKTQSALVSAATYQAGLASRNVAVNGDLDDWTLGGALAPDSFTLTGAGATIARTGIAQADTFHFGTGSGFAAKVTRVGNDWKLTQDIIATAVFAQYVNVKSQKVSVAVKGKTAIASYLRIVVDDGVTTTASTYHTGGNTEEHLSVTHTISASATKLSVYVEGTGSNGDGYLGGLQAVFADLAPTDWSALSFTPTANASHGGTIAVGAQDIPGAKNFKEPLTFEPGTSSVGDATVSGRVSANITAVGNIGGGTDPLMSDTVKANWLSADLKTYRYSGRGIGANNANNKKITVLFDGNTVLDTGNFTTEMTAGWELEVLIIRSSATTCKVFVRFSCFGSASGVRATYTSVTVADWTTNRTLQIQGAATADNDIVQHMGMGEILG